MNEARRLQLVPIAVAAATIVGACTLGSSGPSPKRPLVHFPPANPAAVTEHLDTTRANFATLDAAGGSVVATAGDGTTYRLTLPKGALLGSELITLTPVTSLDDLPFDGMVGAVHISPDGLVLNKPATLTVTPTKPSTALHPVGLLYERAGVNLHLYPLDQSQGLQFRLLHFSTPVVPVATEQQIGAQTQRPPIGTLAQYEQEIAQIRHAQQLGTMSESEATQELGSYSDAFEREIVAPAMAAADQPDATYETIRQAFEDLMLWEKAAQTLGIDSPDSAKYDQVIKRAFDRIFPKLIRQCQAHDIKSGLRAWAIVKAKLVVGSEDAPGLDQVDACLRFQLDFETSQTGILLGPSPLVMTHLKASNIPLHFLDISGGAGPLSYLSYSWHTDKPPCSVINVQLSVSEPFKVGSLGGIEIDYREGHDEVADFFLGVRPGKATANGQIECGYGAAPATDDTSYNQEWEALHRDELIERTGEGQTGYYLISGWHIFNGAVFASKGYQRTISASGAGWTSITESTTLIIRHTPA